MLDWYGFRRLEMTPPEAVLCLFVLRRSGELLQIPVHVEALRWIR